MDHHVRRFMSLTILITILLVWTWVWTLDQDPAFSHVGPRLEQPEWTPTPEFVPPFNEPSYRNGASKFWNNDPHHDSLFFHGVLAEPPTRGL